MGGWVRHRGDAGSRHHMLMKVGTLMAVLFCMFALVLGARGPTRHSSSIPGNTRQGHVTRRFLITPRVAAVVSVVGDFFLCLEDAQTKAEVFCTSDTGGIETAWWVGTSLQRFFYEGYSVRVGAEVWRKKSSGVLVDSIAYDDELGGSGGGSLAFKVGLSLAYGFRSGEASVEVAAASDADPRAVRVSVTSPSGNRVALRATALDSGGSKEGLFGLGERFGPSDQRGSTAYCWCEDGGWSWGPFKRFPKGRETTYMPVPFLVSTKGRAVWLNTTRRTDFDLGSKTEGEYVMQAEGGRLDAVVIAGRTPADSLGSFTALTGRSLVPPKFQLGPWNNFMNEFDRDEPAPAQARRFVELDIPTSVTDYAIHFLPGGSGVGSWLAGVTGEFRALGVAPLAYYNSMVDETFERVYQEAEERGLFVKDERGHTWKFYYKGAKYSPFKVGLLDFTNPGAKSFYADLLDQSTKLGFRGFMYDYGEYVDPLMRFHDGTTGEEAHNAYPLQYQRVAFDYFSGLINASGSGGARSDVTYAPDYVYYSRSGYTGTQSSAWAHWTGDPTCDWDESTGLPAQVKAMLTAGLSGVPFVGSDIGGFVWVDPPSLELWVRWVQVGAVSGIMRMQTGGTSLIGKPKTHVHDTRLGTSLYRRYAKLRTQLFPYLYTASHESQRTGLPLTRHHLLGAWWRDQAAVSQEHQFTLGADLLCAPVVHRGRFVQNVYLPKNTSWFELLGGRSRYEERDGRLRISAGRGELRGGRTVDVEAPLEVLPLMVRAGSAIPTLAPDVDTLNDFDGTSANVTTMGQRAGELHWWAFPTEAGGDAAGEAWDGAHLEVTGGRQMSLQDSNNAGGGVPRQFVVQLAGLGHLGVWGLKRAGSWMEVAEGGGDSWAADHELNTLWVRARAGEEGKARVLGLVPGA